MRQKFTHSLTHSLTFLFLCISLTALSLLRSGTSVLAADAPPTPPPTPLPTPIPPKTNQSDAPSTGSKVSIGPVAIFGVQPLSLPPLDSNCADLECVFAVSGPNDDAGTDPRFGGCVYTTSANEIYFGRCANGSYVTSGFRFPNVQVAKNAKIAQAYLVFSIDGPYANNQSVELRGDRSSYTASGGAAPFSSTNSPASRLLTTTGARWIVQASDAWELGQERQAVDIT